MAYLSNDARREQFIDAATDVIRQEGVAKATTRRIAEVAGASLGSLHYSFRHKEELFIAVLQTMGSGGHLRAAEVVKAQMGLPEAVKAILQAFAQWLDEPENQALIEYEIYIWAARNDKYRQTAGGFYHDWIARITGLLERAQKPNSPPRDLAAIARYLLAVVDGFNWQGGLLGDGATYPLVLSAGRILGRAIDSGEFDLAPLALELSGP